MEAQTPGHRDVACAHASDLPGLSDGIMPYVRCSWQSAASTSQKHGNKMRNFRLVTNEGASHR